MTNGRLVLPNLKPMRQYEGWNAQLFFACHAAFFPLEKQGMDAAIA